MVEVALMRGEMRRLGAVAQAVGDADGQLGELGENVELGEGERGEAVDPDGVTERDEVEPAAAAAAAGNGAVLAAEVTQLLLLGTLDLGRERPLPDSGD